MKNKKMNVIIILILIILAVTLIGGGVFYFLNDKPVEKPKEDIPKKEEIAPDPEAEQYKVNELESIITPDKKIRFGKVTLYRYDGISSMVLNVIPYEDFDNVYVLLTMKYESSNEDIIVYLENLKKNEQVENEVHSLNDWTQVKSWSIKIITEAEAAALGFVKGE